MVLAKAARARADNCEATCRTAKERKPSAETPPVPNIDRGSEITRLSDDVGQEAKRIRCQNTTKQKIHVVMRTDRTCLARSNSSNKRPPQCRRPLDLYVIVSALILGALWPWNYFLAAPILEVIRCFNSAWWSTCDRGGHC